ncbi:MAG: DNA repair protein RecN [Candidatus Methylomirabilia bacterium]
MTEGEEDDDGSEGMLRELRVRNLAVIDEVTVPFAPGLNILTGETGTGKSILLDALLLLSGARAQPDLIRSGAEAAVVEAVFQVKPGGAVSAILEEVGLGTEDHELIVRRELARTGRNRAFVNDSPATLGLLERLGDCLVEIHGQHEHQRLLEPQHQLELLDRFAGAEEPRALVSALVGEWQRERDALADLSSTERSRAQKEDLYRFQLSEIDAARLSPGEEESLRGERRLLQHSERLLEGMSETLHILYDDDQSVAARLGRAVQLLGGLANLSSELSEALPSMETAQVQVDEAVARIQSLRNRITPDPRHLEEIDARLDVLAKLKRKYGESEEAVLAYRDQLREELSRMERLEELLTETEARLARVATEAGERALRLSELRRQAAMRLERLIQRELRTVGMEKARFAIELTREPAPADALGVGPERWRLTARGLDRAEFRLSANPGEELKPLSRVISGGELSRTMLSIKAILAGADRIPTMVFDEVDAGIGGRVADAVGHKLAEAARHRQVLCVTHLSQIGAYAERHLRIEKSIERNRTRTQVEVLDEARRVEELARMLGGEQVTDTARRHARELFRAARQSRSR